MPISCIIDKEHTFKLTSFTPAILVSGDFVFVMVCMYRSLTEKNVLYAGIFTDYTGALQWLGIHLPDYNEP